MPAAAAVWPRLTNGTTTLMDCTLSDNSCVAFSAEGGAVLEIGANSLTTLTDCTISGNTPGGGGAGGVGDYIGGTLVMTGCTVSGNSTGGFGGGLSILATAVLTNCTVSGNTAEPTAAACSTSGFVEPDQLHDQQQYRRRRQWGWLLLHDVHHEQHDRRRQHPDRPTDLPGAPRGQIT